MRGAFFRLGTPLRGAILIVGTIVVVTWKLYTLLAPLHQAAAMWGIVVCIFSTIFAVVLTSFEMDDAA